ncbi:hypothetical protein [Bacillus velezensis]|uniref:hypothetical protein n=1 Tax=Bacillus velezensis TaxID=492670 RepID=UPI0009CBFCD7|nr:hypothetical protein [Bacillus velezensis]SLC54140.1 Uncharacterised protein [Mycobacteroides abscessus subsp. massiliense]
MKFVLSVSKVMKGSQVRKKIEESRENPAKLYLADAEARKECQIRMEQIKKQQAGTLTA